ncbi:MAG: hypothetical protein ACOYOQ_11045 [Microthrixaceae bacterium]
MPEIPLSVISDAAVVGPPSTVSALRTARRRRELAGRDWGELAYRVYTTSLGALVAVVFLSGLVGDDRLDPEQTASLVDRLPAWIAIGVSVVLALAVRSGRRGGPVALERPDVAHLLLAPVSRSAVLRRPVSSLVIYGVGGAAIVGGLAGSLVDQRLDGPAAPWVLSGAVTGATVAAGALGAALVAGGRRVPGRLLSVVAWLLVGWSVAAVASSDVPASPLVLVGDLFVWPEAATPLAVVAVVVAALLVVLGAAGIGGLSIESAMRRTALVGQLRFAVTQQDVRAVVLLRRQLASEHHRRRSWLPRLPRGLADRAPVVARDLASVGRWPLRRIIRVLTAALVAAFAARGVWAGTTPLLIVAGGAAYVLGLDALEPLAQEIDHPTIADSIPVLRGRLALQHLVQPVIVTAVAGTVGAAVAVGVAPSAIGWQVAAVTLLVAVPMGVAGAAITVVSDQTVDAPDAGLAQPEVAGPRLLIRLVWPPMVAVLGFVPLLVARAAVDGGRPPVMPELVVAAPFLLLAAAVAGWVRFRDGIHRTMAESMGGTTGGST